MGIDCLIDKSELIGMVTEKCDNVPPMIDCPYYRNKIKIDNIISKNFGNNTVNLSQSGENSSRFGFLSV